MFILNKVGSFELTYLLNKEREREDADEITSGNLFHASGKNELTYATVCAVGSLKREGLKLLSRGFTGESATGAFGKK